GAPAAGDTVADPVVAGAPGVDPRRAGGDDGDPPAPSRYQTKPAASATSTSATIPTRVSPHSSRRRSANRSRGPPHGPGRGGNAVSPSLRSAGSQKPAARRFRPTPPAPDPPHMPPPPLAPHS